MNQSNNCRYQEVVSLDGFKGRPRALRILGYHNPLESHYEAIVPFIIPHLIPHLSPSDSSEKCGFPILGFQEGSKCSSFSGLQMALAVEIYSFLFTCSGSEENCGTLIRGYKNDNIAPISFLIRF